jgi:two-component system, NarL family, nitrate/nitrite sensor histidine kinase NarX
LSSRHKTHNAQRLPPVTAMIPPGAGWRPKSRGLTGSRLFWPLVGVLAILAALGASGILMTRWPGAAHVLLIAQGTLLIIGLGTVALIAFRVQQYLLDPLGHLRNWALRMRGGNLGARIPVPRSGEFAELARDINSLGESLQGLSRDLDSQVRKQTERLAQQTHSLQVLYDVAASVNVSRDLNDLLTRFLHTLKEVVSARGGAVRLRTDDGQMQLVASIGLTDDVVQRERLLPAHRCLCGKAMRQGEVRSVSTVRQCTSVIGAPMFDHENLEMIAVPLQYRDRTLGVYNLFVDKPGLVAKEGEDIQDLLTSIGRHLGMAIEKTRLDREAHGLALMQERTRMAHELHDSLAQSLASLRFQVKMLGETLQNGQPATRKEVEQIERGLDQAYRELRELLAHFRAPVDGRGLVPAIEDLVAQFRKETGIAAFFQKECAGPSSLPAGAEMQVLRIVQEALANARKHAEARTVRVLLRCDQAGDYRVLVEDDGIGMQPGNQREGSPGEHIGLHVMEERARRVEGELRVESEPGEGTRVVLTFRNREGQQGDPLQGGHLVRKA